MYVLYKAQQLSKSPGANIDIYQSKFFIVPGRGSFHVTTYTVLVTVRNPYESNHIIVAQPIGNTG